jgi:type IV pilus assembly protein PilX
MKMIGEKMLNTCSFMIGSASESTAIQCGLSVRSNAISGVCGKGKQKGAVLIVGLILLMVITLLALAGIQGVSLQQRMSGNAYDRNIAFNTAELGLRWAENRLLNNGDVDVGVVDAATAAADPSSYSDQAFESGGGSWKKSLPGTWTPSVLHGNVPQITVIELDGGNCFKVNSLGKGRDSKTEVVLQSIVCRDS